MTPSVQVEREPLTQLLGLGVLRDSWRLLAGHWWQLIAIATCSYVVHHLVMQVALWAYRAGALPGLLVFSFVPMVPLVATVLMLLTLRRRHGDDRGGLATIVATIGSVLIPFLVVYESQGTFRVDLSTFLFGGFSQVSDAQTANQVSGGEADEAAYDALVLDTHAPLVLAVVVLAFLLRAVGARAAERERLWEASPTRRGLRAALRCIVGYAEVVWIVIGAAVINMVLSGVHDWWQQRRVGRSLADWWAGIVDSFPTFGAIGEGLVAAVATVLDGVVTGLVTPLAWLTIGVVIYGLSASDSISEEEVVQAVRRQTGVGRVTRKVDPAVISLAWRRIADTEGRFGALLGGVAMILRSGFVPVLVFCAVYTVVATWAPYLIWEVARTALADTFTWTDWAAIYSPMQAVVEIAVLCLTAPLLAAFADALLTRFGAESQLRLGRDLQGISSAR